VTQARLKSGLGVRGDSLYCPLAFSLDTYWNCLTDCHHCFFRRLNRTWGQDLRPLDVEAFEKKLINGLKNKNPKTPLAHAIKTKRTLRIGSKADPLQDAEDEWRVTRDALEVLNRLRWSYAIQTRFTSRLRSYEPIILGAVPSAVLIPYMSPGMERDWEVFERKRTTPPAERLRDMQHFAKKGLVVGMNGEPFIPGFHTVKDFENALKAIKAHGIRTYNTYNLHFNDHVAKRMHAIGIDIEKVWRMNQDREWKKILPKLLDLGKKYDIHVGCPDFVNSGPGYVEKNNTCCGVNVARPCRFNTHFWKRKLQKGEDPERILDRSWDGIGDFEQGVQVMFDNSKDVFTMKDAGFKNKRRK